MGTPDDSILLPDPVEPQGVHGGSKHQYQQGPFTFKISHCVSFAKEKVLTLL